MRIYRRTFMTVWNWLEALGIADLGVDQVLPEMHARPLTALAQMCPGGHLRHTARVVTGGSERVLDPLAGGRNSCPRLSREEKNTQAELARIDALGSSNLRQIQGIGWSAVKGRWPSLTHPARREQCLPWRTCAEGKRRGAKTFAARQRRPAAHVQREEGANEDRIVRPNPHRPQHAGVGIGDPVPIIFADAEGSGLAGGAAGSVNPGNLATMDA